MKKYWEFAKTPALVSGSLCILYFLVFYFLGGTLFEGSMGFDMFIPLPFAGITLYYYKKSNDGELRFWEGLVLCSIVTVISLSVISSYIAVHLTLDPDFLSESIQHKLLDIDINKVRYIEMGLTEDDLTLQKSSLSETTIGVVLSSKIMWFSFIGFFYSIILSIIFRK